MTTITLPHATVEQALKTLEAGTDVDPIFAGETEAALRAALAQQVKPAQEPVATLTAQRDALLEALKGLMQQYKDQPECFMDWSKARAAIKSAEETK